ncbi:MAG: hypothetical protein ACLPV8_06540 [Steroidobacteraceae bacterium]
MKRSLLLVVGAVVVVGAGVGWALYSAFPVQMSQLAGMTRDYFLTLGAPPGAATTETNPSYQAPAADPPSLLVDEPSQNPAAGDWPSYNRTLTSQRYSPLSEINAKNVGQLKILCTYDTHQYVSFESGLIVVDNALIGTTQFDIFSR